MNTIEIKLNRERLTYDIILNDAGDPVPAIMHTHHDIKANAIEDAKDLKATMCCMTGKLWQVVE